MNFRKKLYKHLLFLFLLGTISYSSFAQDRTAKTLFIITKLQIVEAQQSQFTSRLEYLKITADGNDSVAILEVEKKLTEQQITKRLITSFDLIFTEEEINTIFTFIQTTAFEKVLEMVMAGDVMRSQFEDIENELDSLTLIQTQNKSIPVNNFLPIPVDRRDGFYETVNYNPDEDQKNIQLDQNPTLTTEDIMKVDKEYQYPNNIPEIHITLTENGKHKFQVLTRNNIKKPIAIVIDKHIISMPIVNEEISGGRVTISGNFTEEELDAMIENLSKKN